MATFLKNSDPSTEEKSNLKVDRLNIFWLTFLYMLQSIVNGLTSAMPLVLQRKGLSYNDQAEFSFVTYPFCFKLLWAPVVDCVYSAKFGRRKTWLVPAQYFIGFLILYISLNLEDWLGDDQEKHKPKINQLTTAFFFLNFIAATQDVSVDGWSLTMLQRKNVGHASTCNNIGLALGQFFGYILFVLLDSTEFCNKFRSVPKSYGFISFADFMFFWAIIYIVFTTIILIFKKDNSLDAVEVSEIQLTVKESYKHLWRIMMMKPIQMVCLLLLTCRISSGPIQGVAPLKLVDAGISPNDLVLLTIPLLPFQAVLPFIFSQKMTGPFSMHCFLDTVKYKIFFGILLAVLLYFASFNKSNTELSAWYYGILLLMYGLDQMTTFIMCVTAQAFYSRISDPYFGGMYLTLLNAVSNTGDRWPVSLCLWLVEPLTWCYVKDCCKLESSCVFIDGFYFEIIFSTILSVAWLIWSKKYVIRLENLDQSSWMVQKPLNSVSDNILLEHKNVLSH